MLGRPRSAPECQAEVVAYLKWVPFSAGRHEESLLRVDRVRKGGLTSYCRVRKTHLEMQLV